jgi:hypothetical protein
VKTRPPKICYFTALTTPVEEALLKFANAR